MDHHAFYFAYLSIIFLSLGILNNRKLFGFLFRLLFYFFFSKQIPSRILLLLLIFLIYYLMINNIKK